MHISDEDWTHTRCRKVAKWWKFYDHMDLDKIIAKMNECWTFVCVDWKWMKINQTIWAIIENDTSQAFVYSHCLGNPWGPFY